jgi:hypothetical protein
VRKPWLVFVLLAAAIFAVTAGVDFYRHRFVRSDRDLLRFLPPTDATIFYVNVDVLRRAGILQVLAGASSAKDADYRAFLRETHFDYTKDVSAIVGSADARQILCLIRGRFDWTRMRSYARSHQGMCRNDVCEVPTSTAGRWASFVPIQSDVMALAISPARSVAQSLRARRRIEPPLPDQPVWVRISQTFLKRPATLPLVLRIFAISLEPADSVILSLAPADPQTSAQFQLELNAQCATAATAETMRNQLEIETKILKLALAREHLQPSAADLTGLLTAGTFHTDSNRVIGVWPIRNELLSSFQ